MFKFIIIILFDNLNLTLFIQNEIITHALRLRSYFLYQLNSINYGLGYEVVRKIVSIAIFFKEMMKLVIVFFIMIRELCFYSDD